MTAIEIVLSHRSGYCAPAECGGCGVRLAVAELRRTYDGLRCVYCGMIDEVDESEPVIGALDG